MLAERLLRISCFQSPKFCRRKREGGRTGTDVRRRISGSAKWTNVLVDDGSGVAHCLGVASTSAVVTNRE